MLVFVVILASSLSRSRTKCQDRPVIFCNPNRFYKVLTITRKYATIKYKELMQICLWLLIASWPPASSRIVLL